MGTVETNSKMEEVFTYKEAGMAVVGKVEPMTIHNMNDPIQLTYQWYTRMGHPTRDDMKKRIRKMKGGANITEDDVDLLPWNEALSSKWVWDKEKEELERKKKRMGTTRAKNRGNERKNEKEIRRGKIAKAKRSGRKREKTKGGRSKKAEGSTRGGRKTKKAA